MNILFFLTPKSEVAYIPANESLRQAFEKLKYHGYSAVPTLTDDGKYAGTITEGDVLRAMESMCHWNISEAEKIKLPDVKRKRNIQAVTISTDMDDLVDVITDQNFVPVIDDQKNFIGIVTRRDIMMYMASADRKSKTESKKVYMETVG